MRLRSIPRPLPVLLLTLSTGCGAAAVQPKPPPTPSKPAVVFPTAAELALLPRREPHAEALGASSVAAEEWTVEEAVPTTEAYDDPSPVGDLVRDIQHRRGAAVTLSVPLRCASHEVARFYLAHHGFPNDSLKRFIVARCGGHTGDVAPVAWSVDAPASVAVGDILSRAHEKLGERVNQMIGRGDYQMGMAMVRDAKHAAIVTLVARRDVDLEPGGHSVDEHRKVALRGVVRREVATIEGLVNKGDYGVSHCQTSPNVPLPKFEVTCELAEGDPWAWVELAGRKKGEMLEESVADVLIYEGDGSAVTYKAKSFGAPAPITSASAMTIALVGKLNAVRGTAKLRPLTLAARQSEENTRLAGTLFEASLEGDGETADRAAIGLLAGWSVEGGTIRNGYFYLGAAAPTRDVTAWLDSALERPLGRVALLDPGVSQIAVGPAMPGDAPALGAAVTTYALFGSERHDADEAKFLRALAAARAGRGLSAPVRVGGFDEMDVQAAEVLLHGKEPMAALDDLVQAAATRTGSSVRGYVFETVDPTLVAFPAELLREGPLNVLVTATHHRAANAAWGQLVIFAITVDGAATSPVVTARGPSTVVTE